METSDESDELIQRVKSRDAEALAEYIQQNRDRLTGFIRSITGDHLLSVVELDDLVQEVSTAALTGLETAPLDQYEPLQWLQQIARRRVVDAHRFHFDAKRRDAVASSRSTKRPVRVLRDKVWKRYWRPV